MSFVKYLRDKFELSDRQAVIADRLSVPVKPEVIASEIGCSRDAVYAATVRICEKVGAGDRHKLINRLVRERLSYVPTICRGHGEAGGILELPRGVA